ncbi:unnamed protein product [Adineta steineri]|uniref:Glutathione synthetase n=1 Tax=Adineta steineri TaxID=433720 RepID=A0A819HPQ7_9BILA|nr:unnamed protein product [Adineta steineri]
MEDDATALNTSLKNIVYTLDRNKLNAECQRWAFANGKCFVQYYFTQNDDLNNDSNVIPYPFTIYPSPYSRNEYEKACQIQYGINKLIHRLAIDINLMDSVFQNLIECDPFIRRLRNIYNHIQQLPYRNVAETCIIRTDYMLQQMNTLTDKTKLRLIEINTISIGLGAAAKLMHAWHKKFLTQVRPDLVSQLPENESHDIIIDTLFESWKIYNKPKAIILLIKTEREFNIGDQMLIEQGLLLRESSSSLLVKQVTFIDVCQNCSLNLEGILYFNDFEVALVYYRSAYDPKHFYNEKIWQAYIMLESSRAIKCPSLRYHLAGMKCFQLALMNKTFLKEVFQENEQHIKDLQDITEEMFTIDQAVNDPLVLQRILDTPESFYLKQSREGGGNVYCGSKLKERIDQIITDKQSNRYFLMSRIYAPIYSSLIRSSITKNNENSLCEKEINGELGIFGSLISQNDTVIYERMGGSLFRSKPTINIEGGIASGQGYIDSILLV